MIPHYIILGIFVIEFGKGRKISNFSFINQNFSEIKFEIKFGTDLDAILLLLVRTHRRATNGRSKIVKFLFLHISPLLYFLVSDYIIVISIYKYFYGYII